VSATLLELMARASAAAQAEDREALAAALAELERLPVEPLRELARGRTLVWLDRPAEAEAAFDAAIALDPEAAHPRFHRGLLRAGRGDDAGALGDFSAAARQDPSFADASYNAGAAARRLGRHEEAARWFGGAARARPGDAEAWRAMIVALRAAGLDDDAERATPRLRELAQLDPAFLAHHELVVEELRVSGERVLALQCVRPRDPEHHVELAFVARNGALIVQLEASRAGAALGAPFALALVRDGQRTVTGPYFRAHPTHVEVRARAVAALGQGLGG
jgi:tetratricopeptide (TPR) repeat protein